ncbi:MAG: hypothetical protein WA966_08910 [Ornithinimicrobium sp.]
MQATVHRFEPDSSTGLLLLDSGTLLPFTAEVFAASGLLKLRLGQRLSIALESSDAADKTSPKEQRVARLWIVGIGEGEVIR